MGVTIRFSRVLQHTRSVFRVQRVFTAWLIYSNRSPWKASSFKAASPKYQFNFKLKIIWLFLQMKPMIRKMKNRRSKRQTRYIYIFSSLLFCFCIADRRKIEKCVTQVECIRLCLRKIKWWKIRFKHGPKRNMVGRCNCIVLQLQRWDFFRKTRTLSRKCLPLFGLHRFRYKPCCGRTRRTECLFDWKWLCFPW